MSLDTHIAILRSNFLQEALLACPLGECEDLLRLSQPLAPDAEEVALTNRISRIQHEIAHTALDFGDAVVNARIQRWIRTKPVGLLTLNLLALERQRENRCEPASAVLRSFIEVIEGLANLLVRHCGIVGARAEDESRKPPIEIQITRARN